jgi:hypothetical protein
MNNILDESSTCAWQQTAEHLEKYFHEVSNAKCLLWVNPAQSDPFEAVPLVEEHRLRVPIRHPRFDVRYGPYLVPLDLRDNTAISLFKESVEQAWLAWTRESLSAHLGQPIAGWVATQAPAQRLATHWAANCHIHVRQRLTKLLRFHDPGVREWLWPTLTEQQRHSLLGHADRIFSIGREHVLQSHGRTSSSFSVDAIPPLALQEEQWAQVEDYASVHAAWLTWRPSLENPENYTTGWEHDVFEALKRATSYGLKDAGDRELFALHVLQFGRDFHNSEEMIPVWKKTLAADHYGNVLEEVFARPVDQIRLHFKNR